MELGELEEMLNELEQRVERLRALYEQYFMGIEKIEPAVLRKDVERRFWLLRRAQIRNTAMRFKLNTINQRYNTYQQYWQRIIREIEAGTYRRHLKKAENRFGTEALTIAARKRLSKKQLQELEAKKQEAADRAKRALEQVSDADSFDVDFEFEDQDDDLLMPPPAAVVASSRSRHALNELDDLESLMGLDAGPTVRTASKPPSPNVQRPAQAKTVANRPPPRPAPKPSADQGFGNIGGVFGEDEDDITAPQPGIPSPNAQPPRPPEPPRRPLPPPQPPPVRPQPRQHPSPPQQPLQHARPAQPGPPQGTQQPKPAVADPATTAAPVRPAPQPPPRANQRPPAQARPAPTPSSSADGLSDERVRQLYREYVSAKRQCNESTSSITEQSLAKSLRGSAAQLAKKHKGKRVDYEVVIKDGRAVLKPVVKG